LVEFGVKIEDVEIDYYIGLLRTTSTDSRYRGVSSPGQTMGRFLESIRCPKEVVLASQWFANQEVLESRRSDVSRLMAGVWYRYPISELMDAITVWGDEQCCKRLIYFMTNSSGVNQPVIDFLARYNYAPAIEELVSQLESPSSQKRESASDALKAFSDGDPDDAGRQKLVETLLKKLNGHEPKTHDTALEILTSLKVSPSKLFARCLQDLDCNPSDPQTAKRIESFELDYIAERELSLGALFAKYPPSTDRTKPAFRWLIGCDPELLSESEKTALEDALFLACIRENFISTALPPLVAMNPEYAMRVVRVALPNSKDGNEVVRALAYSEVTEEMAIEIFEMDDNQAKSIGIKLLAAVGTTKSERTLSNYMRQAVKDLAQATGSKKLTLSQQMEYVKQLRIIVRDRQSPPGMKPLQATVPLPVRWLEPRK